MSSIFTKIINGEIPSFKLYEDDFTYAFLDIFPQQVGHTLIVPKCEIDHFSDVPEPYYSAIFQTAKKLSKALEKTTKAKRICSLFVGYEVPHCHYHLIPTNDISDVNFISRPQANMDELKTLQQEIIKNLS